MNQTTLKTAVRIGAVNAEQKIASYTCAFDIEFSSVVANYCRIHNASITKGQIQVKLL